MLDNNKGEAVLTNQGFKEGEDLGKTLTIQAGEGFVKEHDARTGRHSTPNGDALGLAK